MEPLTESILSLESQADALVEAARAETARIEKAAAERIETLRAEIAVQTEARIAAALEPLQARHEQEMDAAAAQSQALFDAACALPESALRQQAARIVARFSEA